MQKTYNTIRTKTVILICCLLFQTTLAAQTVVQSHDNDKPVAFATISFGNGQGIFADDVGVFVFTKKLYPDIDSLYISALGFKDHKLATTNLPPTIRLESEDILLDEVLVRARIDRDFKVKKQKPLVDDDYFKCWLPTIESEIAVFFPKTTNQDTKVTTVHFPMKVESKDWKKRKKKNADKKPFSTLFKAKFYKNNNGFPGDVLSYETIVFRVTEKDGQVFDLDVSDYDIFVPDNGVFVSIQVLGYTDKAGKLLPNKKYKEIKTNRGIAKIPTNFRPLLPFTDAISEKNTYIKRVFINDNKWVRFEKANVSDSSLLAAGLNNYGIGISLNVYKDK